MTVLAHAGDAVHDTKTGSLTETKVLSVDQGIVEAVVSVTNVLDDVGDIIEPGAYADTLKARVPKGVWSHDWDIPVSKTIGADELMPGDPRLPMKIQAIGGGGLLVTTQFNLDTQAGRDAFSNVKFFADQAEWSIGYVVPKDGSTFDTKTGVRRIQKLELFEYSPVLFGANAHTATVAVKQAISSHKTDTSDEAWDESKEKGGLGNDAGPSDFRKAYAWVDPDTDPEAKSAYRLIHHFCTSDGVGPASTLACLSAIEALNGSLQGSTIPGKDRQGVYNHLAKHLRDAGKDVPDLKDQPSEEGEEKPYDIRKQGSEYCVYNQDTGETVPGGCHPSRADAEEHMRALYANVPDADKGVKQDPTGGEGAPGATEPAGTNADPDPDGDGDDDRVTEVHVYVPMYGGNRCAICKNPKRHKLHKEPDQLEAVAAEGKANADDGGQDSGPHEYEPTKPGDNNSPCSVCGLPMDASIHDTAGDKGNHNGEEAPPEKEKVVSLCLEHYQSDVDGKTVIDHCSRPKGHDGDCGPLPEEQEKGVSAEEEPVAAEQEVAPAETAPNETETPLAGELAEGLQETDKPAAEEEAGAAVEPEAKDTVTEGKAKVDDDVVSMIQSMDSQIDTLMDRLGIPDPDEPDDTASTPTVDANTVLIVQAIDAQFDAFMGLLGIPDLDDDDKAAAAAAGAEAEAKIDVTLAGSFEDITLRVTSAIEANLPTPKNQGAEQISWVEATFADHVLVAIGEIQVGEEDEWGFPDIQILGFGYYSYPYSTVNGVVVLGEAQEVEVAGVVTPKSAKADDISEKAANAIQTKVGRTLSAANAEKIRSAVLNLIEVLGAAGVEIDKVNEDGAEKEVEVEPEVKDAAETATDPTASETATDAVSDGEALDDLLVMQHLQMRMTVEA